MVTFTAAERKKLLECKNCWPAHTEKDIESMKKSKWSDFGVSNFDEYLKELQRMNTVMKVLGTAGLIGTGLYIYSVMAPTTGPKKIEIRDYPRAIESDENVAFRQRKKSRNRRTSRRSTKKRKKRTRRGARRGR